MAEMFAYYLEEGHTLWGLATHLTTLGVATAQGRTSWRKSTVRSILTNPVYTGNVYVGRYRLHARCGRRSALKPVGAHNRGGRRTAPESWTWVTHVPAVVSQEVFDRVRHKLTQNLATAARNNTAHAYLLRSLVSCGSCGLALHARAYRQYSYYRCSAGKRRGESGHPEPCPARGIRADVLDALVWADLCAVLQHPTLVADALQRAHGDGWLPQDLQARRSQRRRGQAAVDRQIERLTEGYLASVLGLDEYRRRRADVEQRRGALLGQEQQLEKQATQHRALTDMISSVEEFCVRVAQGLEEATFAQQRQVVTLLIDRVIVGPDEIEIRYVLPLSMKSEHIPFWQLRSNYADRVAPLRQRRSQRDPVRPSGLHHHQRLPRRHATGVELLVQVGMALRALGICTGRPTLPPTGCQAAMAVAAAMSTPTNRRYPTGFCSVSIAVSLLPSRHGAFGWVAGPGTAHVCACDPWSAPHDTVQTLAGLR